MIMQITLLNNTFRVARVNRGSYFIKLSIGKNTRLYYLTLQRSIYVNLITRVNIIAQQNALLGALNVWTYIRLYLCILHKVTVWRGSNLPITKRAPLIRNSYIQPYLYRIIDRRFYCRLMRRVIEKPRAHSEGHAGQSHETRDLLYCTQVT